EETVAAAPERAEALAAAAAARIQVPAAVTEKAVWGERASRARAAQEEEKAKGFRPASKVPAVRPAEFRMAPTVQMAWPAAIRVRHKSTARLEIFLLANGGRSCRSL